MSLKEGKLDSILKGKIAEAIVEYAFRLAKKPIFQTGTIDGRARIHKYFHKSGIFDPMLSILLEESVRSKKYPVPDFTIINKKREIELIEVKYKRHNHESDYRMDVAEQELYKIWSEWKCKLILVTDDPFPETGCFTVLTVQDQEYMFFGRLSDEEDWGINTEIEKTCEELVKRFFPINK